MTFADRLKMLREKHGWTQQDLADKLNIARNTIAGYETKGKIPREETLIAIANLFNTSIDYLLGRTDDPSRPDELDIPYDPNDPYWKKATEIYEELKKGKKPVVHGLDILTILSLPEKEQRQFAKALKRIAESLERNLNHSESTDQ